MNTLSQSANRLIIAGVLGVFTLGGCASIIPSAKKEPPAEAVAAPAPAPADSDNDGVPDDQDACPGTRAGAPVDHKGCEIIGKLENAHFEFDSAELTAEAKGVLDAIAAKIAQFPDRKFEVAGHADSMGSDDYNNKLGQRRAESVANYLASAGASAGQLMTRSYGESKPVASNDTEEGRAMNRRVEVVEISM